MSWKVRSRRVEHNLRVITHLQRKLGFGAIRKDKYGISWLWLRCGDTSICVGLNFKDGAFKGYVNRRGKSGPFQLRTSIEVRELVLNEQVRFASSPRVRREEKRQANYERARFQLGTGSGRITPPRV